MFTDQTLIIINVTSIAFLSVLMIVLVAATRMKGGAGWAALILASTTVPVYLANLTRDLGMDYFLYFLYPAIFFNAICFPATWFLVRSLYEKTFCVKPRYLLHAIPAVISLLSFIIYYAPMSAVEIEASRAFMEAGGESPPAVINDVILFGQFFAYFTVMFIYIHKRMKFLRDHYSDSDFLNIKWVPNFILIFFVLFFIVFVAYMINPRTDTWLIPILNSVGMAYLVYCVIFHSTRAYINRLPEEKSDNDKSSTSTLDTPQMKEICEQVMEYLQNSRAYANPEFSLAMLSVETGISQKNISRSINGYLNKNFFDLVNEMRVKEAKTQLDLLEGNHTIDSVCAACGFNSSRSFFRTFKKFESTTPAQWLREREKFT